MTVGYYYLTPTSTASPGNAILTTGDETITTVSSSGAFASVSAGALMIFNYTTTNEEYKGWWAVVATKTSSDSLEMDRQAPYTKASPGVAWRYCNTKYDLGKVNSMRFGVQTSATVLGMPQQNTRNAILIDQGPTRTITIQGKIDGTSDNVTAALNLLAELQTGQQTTANYILCAPHLAWWSGNGAWHIVGIKSFDWTYDKPNGTVASYTLQCVEKRVI